MSAPPENNTIEKANTEQESKELRTTKLQESLKSVYESSRIATELSELRKKLNSLYEVKNSLKAGGDSANMELLNQTIIDLEHNMENKHADMVKSQEQFVTNFLQVMENVAEYSKQNSSDLLKTFEGTLQKFGANVFKKLDDQREKLIQLEKNKLDNSVKDDILNEVINVRTAMESLVEDKKKEVTEFSISQARTVLNKVVEVLDKFHKQRDGLEAKIEENLTKKSNEKIEELKKQLAKMIGTQVASMDQFSQNFFKTRLSDQIAQEVKDQLETQTVSTKIQDIIKSLPEYKALKETATKTNENINLDQSSLPNLEVIKNSLATLTHQITELKQSNQQTRAIVDTMRLPASAIQDPNQFDHAVAVKRMEEMAREVNVIHNNVKMIEAMVNLKTTGLDEQVVAVVRRKRARAAEAESSSSDMDVSESSSSNTTAMTTITENMKEEYLARLTDVEVKHQKLLDFILQCKDSVLDDLFPTRLEAAMAKIEQILVNHERFIQFLIDPFSTAANNKSISIPTTTNTPPEGTLNPAMIDAIQQLVKQQAEEISLPLQKKIKLLEEKLEARQQQQQ